MQVSSEIASAASESPLSPLHKASSYDIRHIGKAAAAFTGHDLQKRVPSHDSSATQASEPAAAGAPGAAKAGDSRENGNVFSVEKIEASLACIHGVDTGKTSSEQISEETKVGLELTLGFDSVHGGHSPQHDSSHGHRRIPSRSDLPPDRSFLKAIGGSGSTGCREGLGLGLESMAAAMEDVGARGHSGTGYTAHWRRQQTERMQWPPVAAAGQGAVCGQRDR